MDRTLRKRADCANSNFPVNYGAVACRWCAAYKSELEKVREFLDKGANVNVKNEYGDTALIYDIKDQ